MFYDFINLGNFYRIPTLSTTSPLCFGLVNISIAHWHYALVHVFLSSEVYQKTVFNLVNKDFHAHDLYSFAPP